MEELIKTLRSLPWPSRSRVLDVAVTEKLWQGVTCMPPGLVRKSLLERPDILDPWGGVTSQELAFAEALAFNFGEAIYDLSKQEYRRAGILGERSVAIYESLWHDLKDGSDVRSP